ncbi:MAG: hypothetical protein KGH65_02505 [Candidatus Micrarchaeota archaeon]|nr:hypothetical protein [Candidatus Micrarchaeota archaeon]
MSSSCTLQVSNTAIAFPSTAAGNNAPLANTVSATNNGNVEGYIWISGTSWATSANSAINFFVTNTIFSNAPNQNAAGYLANALTLSASNTAVLIPAITSNTLYFGVNIPAGQASNTYTQNIIFQTVC